MDLESEVTKLRKLLADRDGNAESLKEQLRKSSKELEHTKKILAQKENELISARASLHEGDKLLYTFRQTCSEIQLELEKTKRGLIEKSVALDYSERYAKMLFWSARAKDREIDMTNKLVNKVVQDVERVEKLLEIKTQAKTYEGLSQETLTKMELSKNPSNEVNAVESSPGQLEKVLEEKDKTKQQLQSSLTQLKQELGRTGASPEKTHDELQLVISDFHGQEKDLEIFNGSKLQEENKSLRNELKQLNSLFTTQDDEKELRKMVIKTDSELKTNSSEMEKLKFLLQAKEKIIEVMKCDLAEKECESKSLNEHLQKKMAEIRRFQQTLDNMKIESCKSLEDYPSIIEHMKASGRSAKYLEDLRKALEHKVCDDIKRKLKSLESVVARLEQDLMAKNVLLQEKDEELATANRKIQQKKEELDILKVRLRQLEEKFDVCGQNASERESKLKKENNPPEDRVKHLEMHLSQKQHKTKESRSLLGTEGTDWERNKNPVNVTKQEKERNPRTYVKEKKKLSEVDVVEFAGEQNTNAMADRMRQMLEDMNAVQMALESKRNENWILTKKNQALEERVKKVGKQITENDKMHSERLNNVLDNVRLKMTEIQSQKALLRARESQREANISKVS